MSYDGMVEGAGAKGSSGSDPVAPEHEQLAPPSDLERGKASTPEVLG